MILLLKAIYKSCIIIIATACTQPALYFASYSSHHRTSCTVPFFYINIALKSNNMVFAMYLSPFYIYNISIVIQVVHINISDAPK